MKKNKKPFDKYWHYRNSVQSPDEDVRFIRKCYRELKKAPPLVFREDFSSTFALSCGWIRLGPRYRAVCVDIDKEPLEYGRRHYLSRLTRGQQSRLKVIHSNVLSPGLPKADIVGVLNFSYSVFKERKVLRKYFAGVFKSLKSKGIFVLDCFGGSDCYEPNEEREDIRGFTYYWDQENFDPVSHHARFHIHYKRRGEKKREKVFSYDWRLWSIPEIREILKEAGFTTSHVYWEGTDKNGEGDGQFTRQEEGEDCESWVAYIVAEK